MLSEPLRGFLRAKYLHEGAAIAAAPAATLAASAAVLPRSAALRRRIVAGLKLGALALTIALFAMLAMLRDARADSVVLAEDGLVIGSNQSDTFSFSAPAAGTLDVKLADLNWPSPLSDLMVSITSADAVLGTLTHNSEHDFTLSAGGTYYAHLLGSAGGSLNLGAYGLLAIFQPLAPVPLPASVTLLLSGLVATAWSMRRRRLEEEFGAVPPCAPSDAARRKENVTVAA